MRKAALALIGALCLAAGCSAVGPGQPLDAASLPQASINGVSGSWAVDCWSFGGPIFGTAVCDGPSGSGDGSPGGPPYRLTFSGEEEPVEPTSLDVVVQGAVDIDHNPHGQGDVAHPQWAFAFPLQVGAQAKLAPIPDGPWLSLEVRGYYPQGSINWRWPIEVPLMSRCTELFSIGVADATLAWIESFDIDEGAPGSLTDTSVTPPQGSDRLGEHLDKAIAACPTKAAWVTAWDTFLGQPMDGSDAPAFLKARCAELDLQDMALCRAN